MQVNIPLTEPQKKFCFSPAKNPAIIGGLGSGKSRAGTMRLILLMLSDKGINTAYYMPTYDLIKLRAMVGVEEDLVTLGLPHTVNKSDYSITIHGYGTMIFRSYDRPERIIAYEVAHSLVDEIDTLNRDQASFVWRKVSERNRQSCNGDNTIGCVTTPDSGLSGFVYARWGKNPKDGYELIKASTRSNPYLPEGYVQQILDNYDPLLAEMYIEGEFVSLNQNKVYHFFDRKKHHSDRILLKTDSVLYVSIDFNIGGCCAVVFVIENNNPIAIDEFISHDTRDFIHNLSKFRQPPDGFRRKIIVYPDASGKSDSTNATASDIELIENAGYRIDCPNKNPFVRDRINAYNGLLSHNKILINTNKCQLLTDALETQGYDDKGKPEKFSDHPSVDDWTDSSGYFINQKFPVIKPVIITGIRSTV